MNSYNCRYCGTELSETMNCTGCGSSTGEAETVTVPARHGEYGCHECGAHSFSGGYCTCGNVLEEL